MNSTEVAFSPINVQLAYDTWLSSNKDDRKLFSKCEFTFVVHKIINPIKETYDIVVNGKTCQRTVNKEYSSATITSNISRQDEKPFAIHEPNFEKNKIEEVAGIIHDAIAYKIIFKAQFYDQEGKEILSSEFLFGKGISVVEAKLNNLLSYLTLLQNSV